MNQRDSVCDHGRYGPGCERHKGDPHNLCQACWALEPDREPSLTVIAARILRDHSETLRKLDRE